jgi:hypothetical protein
MYCNKTPEEGVVQSLTFELSGALLPVEVAYLSK